MMAVGSARERIPHFQRLSAGSGRISIHCSRMASAISVDRMVRPTAAPSDVASFVQASSAPPKAVDAVVVSGNSAFIGRTRK